MRYFLVVAWLLLGFLYYWGWNNSINSCCTSSGITSTEFVAPITPTESEKEKARKEADEKTEKAIADAAETKTVTSIKTTDVSGKNKLTFYFPYNSSVASYSAGTESDLSEIVASVKESGRKVVITGHTDDSGPTDTNRSLGQQRADDIRKKLISSGLPSSQVVARSFGEEQPIATNETSSGRQRNRRVELVIE